MNRVASDTVTRTLLTVIDLRAHGLYTSALEVADVRGMSKSTIHAHLVQLRELGLIEYGAAGGLRPLVVRAPWRARR